MEAVKERDKIHFFDTAGLQETPGIRGRCNTAFLEQQLRAKFPGESFRVSAVSVNESGRYKRKGGSLARMAARAIMGIRATMKGLPAYCEVCIEHKTGAVDEHIIVWAPLAWNNRFAGTAGGGTVTGGRGHITPPNNTSRGLSLPIAVINGFAAATTDAGNHAGGNNWALDRETRALNWDLIENWISRSTHNMTLFGKAVAEILHQRPVQYAYLHGGSGGGRQSMVEAMEYPEDYNGIWASCPAIYWPQFVIAGFWPMAVMNRMKHVLTLGKIRAFADAVHKSVGGREAFYRLNKRVEFDPATVIGQKSKDGPITQKDADVMRAIWDGPRRANGERLWFAFWPGVTFWQKGLPLASYYYPFFGKPPKPFPVAPSFARWALQDPDKQFDGILPDEVESLYDKTLAVFEKAKADNADLRPFAAAGGKLMIDHGTEDPLIPLDGTLHYYERLCEAVGGKARADAFCRLYVGPGDGHGNCFTSGPGLTEADGMRALMGWVENQKAPGPLRAVHVARKSGGTIRESTLEPV